MTVPADGGTPGGVHLVAPEGVDDPWRPSGGNLYDCQVTAGLRAAGWHVTVDVVPRPPSGVPGATADEVRQAVGEVVTRLPDGALLLVDGLVAVPAAGVLVRESTRVRLVVLVHMATPEDPGNAAPVQREREVLRAASAVVATSHWTGRLLSARHGLEDERLHVAVPGVHPGEPTEVTRGGGRLLCVANLGPWKGQDVLLEALGAVRELRWTCAFVGSPDLDEAFTRRVHGLARRHGLVGRIGWAGVLVGDDLAERYSAADLLVHPTLGESYGMVVAEALARGLPVLASDVGGVPEALGTAPSGVPGLLVPPGDPEALARGLRSWLEDSGLRRRLVRAARERRTALPDWASTARQVACALVRAAR